MNEHQNGKDHEMKPRQCLGQAFVISREPAKAVQPAEAALHHPTAWQQHEGFFRLGQLDHVQLNAFIKRRLRGFLARISLIGERYLDRLARGSLDLTSEFPGLRSLLLVCWPHMHRKQPPQGIDRHIARTIQRNALNISRNSYRRCGASLLIDVRYGAAKCHSSSDTSVG